MEALVRPVNPILHEVNRLTILALLHARASTFAELKHESQLTDGNLDSHLGRLVNAGYVRKTIRTTGSVRRGRETVYTITEKGSSELDTYLEAMQKKLDQARRL